MRTIKIENDSNAYQFSVNGFRILRESWEAEKHEGLDFQEFLEKKLYVTKDCFYNYINGRNGMPKETIFDLASLLNIKVTDLLEVKRDPIHKEELKYLREAVFSGTISDFSKKKLFEIYEKIDRTVQAFFTIFDAEEEFYDLLELIRVNSVAIPGSLMENIESFVYGELEPMVDNPGTYFSKLPHGNDFDTCKARNVMLSDMEHEFVYGKLGVIRSLVNQYLVN